MVAAIKNNLIIGTTVCGYQHSSGCQSISLSLDFNLCHMHILFVQAVRSTPYNNKFHTNN